MNDNDNTINENTELEDTDRIQKAIEDVIDEETAVLPSLPVLEDNEAEIEDPETLPVRGSEDRDSGEDDYQKPAHIETRPYYWFFTFMCMNIPIAGWIYLLYLAFNKKKTDRRYFARAYLFYKLLFLLVAAVILGILLYFGLQVMDQLLDYMEML